MSEFKSISKDMYDLIQEHANALSKDKIENQPHHLILLSQMINVAKEDWMKKNE